MAANLSQFIRNLLCIGFFSSGLSTVCATELTSDDFYEREQVQEIRLTISGLNLKKMKEALPERKYVPATFHWRNIRLENVGVRYKGNSSSQPRQSHKRGYLIKVSEFKKGTRFLNLRRIALDNGVQFGSLFSEPIVTDILRDLNVPSSRCNYAKLFINDDYQGVYGNVERIDESFIEWHFGSKKGPLFKVNMPGPGANFSYAGDDPTQYKKGFEAKNKAAEKSFDELIDLIREIDKGDKSNYEQTLNKHLMFEHFLKTTAVMLFAGCFDQLTGWNPHNYYLYRIPKQIDGAIFRGTWTSVLPTMLSGMFLLLMVGTPLGQFPAARLSPSLKTSSRIQASLKNTERQLLLFWKNISSQINYIRKSTNYTL